MTDAGLAAGRHPRRASCEKRDSSPRSSLRGRCACVLRGASAAPELRDLELGLAQPRLTRRVETQPLLVELDALLEPDVARLQRLHRALKRGDELVERLARQ